MLGPQISDWKWRNLDQKGHTIVEYIWIGGHGDDLRSKAKTFKGEITSIEQLIEWNYDGSSTMQEKTETSEINIVPVALYDDPFRGAPNKLVLCETFHTNGTPTLTNFRNIAKKIFEKDKDNKLDPWFGCEQEYILMQKIGSKLCWPYGWAPGWYPQPQGMNYGAQGAKNIYGRDIADAHYKACLYAGLKVFGQNAEVMPGQWEYQVGTCHGLELADHHIVSRWILLRVAEKWGVDVTFDPKPIKGDWNGSGAHMNYSNNLTRTDIKHVYAHLDQLSETHKEFISVYGVGNDERLTGKHETSSMDKFTYDPMNRASSIRIPGYTLQNGKGYFEDRRPAGNADPYAVIGSLFSVTCLDKYLFNEIVDQMQRFKSHRKENCQLFTTC